MQRIRGLWWFLAACTVIMLCILQIDRWTHRHRLAARRTFVTSAYRQISSAVEQYVNRNGVMPYHEAGGDHALFLLKDYVRAEHFGNGQSHIVPEWDTSSYRLRNGAWTYLNVYCKDIDEHRAYFAVDALSPRGIIGLGMPDGQIVWVSCNKARSSDMVGTWVTGEGLLIGSKQCHDRWVETHDLPGVLSTTHDGGILIETRNEEMQIIYRFTYSSNMLVGCEIVGDGVKIIERFSTDAYARLDDLSRSPPEWRESWDRYLQLHGRQRERSREAI